MFIYTVYEYTASDTVAHVCAFPLGFTGHVMGCSASSHCLWSNSWLHQGGREPPDACTSVIVLDNTCWALLACQHLLTSAASRMRMVWSRKVQSKEGGNLRFSVSLMSCQTLTTFSWSWPSLNESHWFQRHGESQICGARLKAGPRPAVVSCETLVLHAKHKLPLYALMWQLCFCHSPVL